MGKGLGDIIWPDKLATDFRFGHIKCRSYPEKPERITPGAIFHISHPAFARIVSAVMMDAS